MNSWDIGEWSECSKTCGLGMQHRQILCRQIYANRTLNVHVSHCQDLERPETSSTCQLKICSEWQIRSEWTAVSIHQSATALHLSLQFKHSFSLMVAWKAQKGSFTLSSHSFIWSDWMKQLYTLVYLGLDLYIQSCKTEQQKWTVTPATQCSRNWRCVYFNICIFYLFFLLQSVFWRRILWGILSLVS